MRDFQRHISAHFLNQPLPNVPGGDKFAIIARQWSIVHRELHLNCWRINGNEGQRLALKTISDGFTDKNLLESGQANDVSGVGFGYLDALHPLEVINRRDFGGLFAAIPVDADRGIAHFDFAANNFPEGDAPEIIGIIKVRDE